MLIVGRRRLLEAVGHRHRRRLVFRSDRAARQQQCERAGDAAARRHHVAPSGLPSGDPYRRAADQRIGGIEDHLVARLQAGQYLDPATVVAADGDRHELRDYRCGPRRHADPSLRNNMALDGMVTECTRSGQFEMHQGIGARQQLAGGVIDIHLDQQRARRGSIASAVRTSVPWNTWPGIFIERHSRRRADMHGGRVDPPAPRHRCAACSSPVIWNNSRVGRRPRPALIRSPTSVLRAVIAPSNGA